MAAQTAAAARRLPERPWFDARATELERLLAAVGDERVLEEFVERNLGPLRDHDRDHKLALLGTLQALCAHGGHKASAARDLHLHRQALYHRIARIEALLGVDLSDAARLTTLDLACARCPTSRTLGRRSGPRGERGPRDKPRGQRPGRRRHPGDGHAGGGDDDRGRRGRAPPIPKISIAKSNRGPTFGATNCTMRSRGIPKIGRAAIARGGNRCR